jgi:hypothetical protein
LNKLEQEKRLEGGRALQQVQCPQIAAAAEEEEEGVVGKYTPHKV